MGQMGRGTDLRREFAAPELRRELLGLCRLLTGDAQMAEDAVQETLLEALRRADSLPEPEAWRPWLGGVARNVCRRWRARRGRDAALAPFPTPDALPETLIERPMDEVEAIWEREEMATLAVRMMRLLPPEPRRLLTEFFVENIPQSESAARRGISENMVAVRLHRGKRLMRRLLARDAALRTEAAAYGLIDAASGEGWHDTNLWCRWCGQSRIAVRFVGRAMETNCPRCNPRFLPYADATTANAAFAAQSPKRAASVKSVKPIMKRLNDWWADWYQAGSQGETLPCPKCGRQAARFRPAPPELRRERTRYPVYARCAACRAEQVATPSGVALKSAALLRFWQRHPRLRVQPEQCVTLEGAAAIRVRFESLDPTNAALTIFLNRETFATLHTVEEGLGIRD